MDTNVSPTDPLWLRRAISILRENAHVINLYERTQIVFNRAGDHVEADINNKSIKASKQDMSKGGEAECASRKLEVT